MHNRFESLLISRPVTSLMIAVAIVLLMLPAIPKLQLDFGVRIWFHQDDQMIQDFDRFKGILGSENYVFLAMTSENGDLFENHHLRTISELTEKLYLASKVQRVDSISNFTDIFANGDEFDVGPLYENKNYTETQLHELKAKALKHPLLPGQYLSRNGESALFLIRLGAPSPDQITYQKSIRELRNLIAPYEKNKDYSFQMVGTSKVVDEFRNIAQSDLLTIIPLLCLILGLLVFLIFRSIKIVALVFSIIGTTIFCTVAMSGYMSFTLNNLSGMVPGVVIAIAIADSIHFLSVIFMRGQNILEDARYSLKKNLLGTFLTTLTTSIGFFSLTFSDLVPISNFGFLCGIGSIFAWLFSLLIIFPSMTLFDFKSVQKKAGHQTFRSYSSWVSRLCVTHPGKIILIFSVVGATFLWMSTKNEVNSNPFEYFSHDLKVYQDNQKLNKLYGGFSNFEVMVDSQKTDGIYNVEFLNSVDELQTWMKANIDSSYVVSLADYVKKLNQAQSSGRESEFKIPDSSEEVAQLLMFYTLSLSPGLDQNHMRSLDGRYLRITNFWGVQSSKEFMNNVEKLKEKAQKLNLDILVTGREYLYNGMNDYVIKSYFTSIAITVFLISILLVFILKSFKLGLISLIPNLFSIIIGSGSMYLMGKPIDVGTILVASVCFGIAIDDTIHFLLDVKRKNVGDKKNEEVFNSVFNDTGFALVVTTFLLVTSFLVFLMADFIPNYNFGLFSSIILVTALLTDLVLLPAIIKKYILKSDH